MLHERAAMWVEKKERERGESPVSVMVAPRAQGYLHNRWSRTISKRKEKKEQRKEKKTTSNVGKWPRKASIVDSGVLKSGKKHC